MGYTNDIVERIKDEFERTRELEKELAEKRRAEVWEKIPAVKLIDDELSKTGMKLYGAAMSGSDNIEEKIEALKKENLALQENKAYLLSQNGFPVDYTKVKYHCKKCSDSGYVGLEMCSCMKTAVRKAAYLSSGLGKMLDSQSFENFKLSYYPDTAIPSMKLTCRANMEFILSEAMKYVSDFTANKADNLIFYGGTGLGKTHISTCIAKGVIDKGYEVIYDTAQNILNVCEAEKFGKSNADGSLTSKYSECDLLIIDDMGAEFKTTFSQAALYNLINARICAGSAMIISTNLDSPALLEKTYDKRMVSRLIGNFRSFLFTGNDIRLMRAKRN